MSIGGKLNAWVNSPRGQVKMQSKIKEYVKNGVKTTNAGDSVINEPKIYEAAAKLISVLQSTAQSYGLPASVMRHFSSLQCSKIYTMPDGTSQVYIYFGDDLHRDSLYSDGYDGVHNIVALLNNGYHASNYVYGDWDGHAPTGESVFDGRSIDSSAYIRSRKDREGLHFIQQAISDFNGNYSADYNATAIAGDEYQ